MCVYISELKFMVYTVNTHLEKLSFMCPLSSAAQLATNGFSILKTSSIFKGEKT